MWNRLWYDSHAMKKKSKIIQVPMPEDLVAKLDAISSEVEESRSFVIREAVAKYITAREEAEAIRKYVESYEKYPESPDVGEAQMVMIAGVLEPEDFSDWPDYPWKDE